MDPVEREVRTPTLSDLDIAWEIVQEVLPATPLVPSPIGPHGSLKLETLQPTGAFKVRGALAALSSLEDGKRAVTASAGNHGLGVAWAASRLGQAATIVVSRNASPAKVEAIRAFPIELVEHGNNYDDAEKYALSLLMAGAASFVSPYNDPMVIAGQGTIGLELDVQSDDELTVVAPVGGGGLLSGLALWSRTRDDVHLAGVESTESRAVSAAVAAGRVEPMPVGDTIADGLAGNLEPGSVTPGILKNVPLVAVDDEQLRGAMRWLFTNHGIVAEASGAAGVAAVLASKIEITGQLVVVVSGRNIAATQYAEVLQGS
jgi:threonine dehydratase